MVCMRMIELKLGHSRMELVCDIQKSVDFQSLRTNGMREREGSRGAPGFGFC